MITIAAATRNIVFEDEVALQALNQGLLNLSAYAEKILPQVEAITFKEVKKGSIVVALSRIAAEIADQPSLKPEVKLDSLNIKSTLSSVTFDNTLINRREASQLTQALEIKEKNFFAMTQSTSEITIILSQDLLSDLLAHFTAQPKAVFRDLVGLSVQFSDDYLSVPNVLFTLQAALAVRQINLIEVVSTYTEFCFILAQKDLDVATNALKKFVG